MWGARRLCSSVRRFLGVFGSGFRGTLADYSRLTLSAVFSENQPSWTLPWVFNEYRDMWPKSCRMTFACLNRMKCYRKYCQPMVPWQDSPLGVRSHVTRETYPWKSCPMQWARYPWTRLYSTMQSTVDSSEVKTFQALAHRWWDEQGVYAPLHSMNDLRVPFIRDNLLKTVANHQAGRPLSGMKILDVGCGGGLLTEPLGRLGASVIGIDPVEENIKTAQTHKSFDPVLDTRIEYRVCSLEEIMEEATETFDAVVASEVVEHVIHLETFIQSCYQVLKPGGSLFITTINKTQLSYALGIVFAEQIAGFVQKGTHSWEKFVSPEKLESILESNGLSVQTVVGMLYNPFSGYWRWIENTSLNYAAHAVKPGVQEPPVPTECVLKGEMEESQAKATTNPESFIRG
ncbi:ubiquinone biosynthesis O-methyltransferase, mitochondrial isoform X2 [Tamandua tetradactyla]|uniref:ubiquinone biosynthesis O-methyltransferase, mitochondrial isoform X2 n=1 Tax=Tamandua tetradactyla TaxID=48850 RepID=UPI0040540EA9